MSDIVGAILAGGHGRRLGGDKAVVELDGRPLLDHVRGVLAAVLDELVVVAKPSTRLPPGHGLEVWKEPEEPSHPLAGLVHALSRAEGRRVFACAVDMPLLTPEAVRAIVDADPAGHPAVVPRTDGGLQPLCALYLPEAGALLAGFAPGERARDVVAAIDPLVLDVADAEAFFNVNTPEELLLASGLLAARRSR